MDYKTTKWIIFAALFLTVPALFFLVMAVMFVPAVFFIAGIGYVTQKLFIHGNIGESLSFIVLLGVHMLIYAAVYYGISVAIAHLIKLIKNGTLKVFAVAAVCFGLVVVTQFPVYGGGGHGPMRWYTLAELLAEVNTAYGNGTAQIVYGGALVLLTGLLLFQKQRKTRTRQVTATNQKAFTGSSKPVVGAVKPGPDEP